MAWEMYAGMATDILMSQMWGVTTVMNWSSKICMNNFWSSFDNGSSSLSTKSDGDIPIFGNRNTKRLIEDEI